MFHHDCVADSEQRYELFQESEVLVRGIVLMDGETGIFEVHIGNAWFQFTAWIWYAIRALPRSEHFKLHHIARERARLIREDVLDLPQFFIQIRGLRDSGKVLLHVIHHVVVRDEHRCIR